MQYITNSIFSRAGSSSLTERKNLENQGVGGNWGMCVGGGVTWWPRLLDGGGKSQIQPPRNVPPFCGVGLTGEKVTNW